MKFHSSICFFLAGLASTALATTTVLNPAVNPTKTCVIPAKGTGEDDSPAIRDAFAACRTNGHIVFQPNTTYHLNSVLQLHNLSHVQVDLLGTLLVRTTLTIE